MLITNLDYLESISDLTIEGGAKGKGKMILAPKSLNQALSDALAEAFGPYTFTSAISGTSTTLGSSFSSASSVSISSNRPIKLG
jgi:hypothetical protein